MRIANWPALVCGWVLATLIGQTVLAADLDDEFTDAAPGIEAGDGSGLIGDPGAGRGSGSAYQPVQFGEPGGFGEPGMGPPHDGAYAPGMSSANAWPETSPFNQHRIEQVYNEAGLWTYDSDDNFRCKRMFALDYLYGHGAGPGAHLIGDPAFKNTPFDPDDVTISLFPSHNTNLYSPQFHNGMRVWYGWEAPDDSGFLMSGFILFENSQSNKQFITNQQAGNLQPIASIVVNDGGTGVALPFDTRFFQQFTQEIMGADADYYFMPFLTRPNFKVKMLLGAKYLRFSESFYVQGNDSGLGYGLDLPPLPTFELPYVITAPYTTTINSSVTNNLVGPTIGVRYDLGGNKFKLWGQSKFGVMADIESRSVSSSNLNQFKIAVPEAVIDPNVLPGPAVGAGIPPSRVTSNSTHVAALFDQQFMMEFPFFSVVPYLNRFTILREGNVRIGWQYVVVSEVARAGNQIIYNINEPLINSHRTWWSYNTFNFGMNWRW
jgi:hypothetical protein